MRKFFTILSVCLLVSLSLLAQNKKSNKIRLGLGVKTGVNLTHFNIDDLSDNTYAGYSSKYRTGFVLGGFVTIPVYHKFSIQPEFLYSSMGGDYWTKPTSTSAREHIRARYNYFSIPVLAKYNFYKHLTVFAGPQFDQLITGRETNSSGAYKVSDYLKDNDVFIAGGLEFWASRHIVFQVKYMRGFNDVDNRANGVRYYQEGVQATFGVKF